MSQTAANVTVDIRRETAIGVQATATGAMRLRITDSPGLTLRRVPIQSQEKRDDALKSMGRLGAKTVDGSYNAELTVGGDTNLLLEAILRTTWATQTVIGYATMTTVAIGTNQVVAAGGSFITQGIRVGDIFRLSGTDESANNNLNTRVTALTTLTISVATGTFTIHAADATGTITVLRKLTNPTTPTRLSHTVEQHDQDTDLSELFLGCRLVGVRLSCRPGQPVQATYTFQGVDRTALATGTSPYFTTPTVSTGLMLAADDASVRYNGATVATFTGVDLDFQITARGEAVLGSFVYPDIYDNDLAVTGSITGIRSDFSNLTLYDAETEFEVGLLLQELASAPKPCYSLFFPRVKLAGVSAPVGGGDGAKIETLDLMIGPKVSATDYDAGVVVIHSSSTA